MYMEHSRLQDKPPAYDPSGLPPAGKAQRGDAIHSLINMNGERLRTREPQRTLDRTEKQGAKVNRTPQTKKRMKKMKQQQQAQNDRRPPV
eukprot:jgi/Chrzof1/5917/Cz16g20180.t1